MSKAWPSPNASRKHRVTFDDGHYLGTVTHVGGLVCVGSGGLYSVAFDDGDRGDGAGAVSLATLLWQQPLLKQLCEVTPLQHMPSSLMVALLDAFAHLALHPTESGAAAVAIETKGVGNGSFG